MNREVFPLLSPGQICDMIFFLCIYNFKAFVSTTESLIVTGKCGKQLIDAIR